MKNFMNFLKKHSKKLAIISVVSIAVLGVSSVTSWGPDRPTKAYQEGMKGFDHVTFNSFTGVPNIGDERNFLTGKFAGHEGGFYDPMNNITAGDEVLVRAYVHNNADESINASGKGVAKNVRVRVELPTTKAQSVTAKAFITADNAQPKSIHDELEFKDKDGKAFSLSYVPGSTQVTNNSGTKNLPDGIVNGGISLGDQNGCFKDIQLVTFKIKVANPRYDLSKQVRKSGTTEWKESVAAKSGDTVDYLITYKNAGDVRQEKVVIVDKLPEGASMVPNSTYLKNSNHPSNDYKPANQTGIVDGGLSIGNYAPGGVAYVKFSAKITAKAADLECGPNKLKNWAYGAPEGETPANDDADVTIEKECEEPQPKYACDALEADKTSLKIGETANFTARASASGGAQITGYIFRVNGQTVQDSSSNEFAYEATAEGTFNVSVIVKTNKGNTAESEKCKKQIKVTKEEPKPEYECKSLTATRLDDKKYRFDVETRVRGDNVTVNKYVFNFGDNTEEVSTTESTVEHTYAEAGNYTASVRVVFNVGSEQKDANCIVKINIPKKPSQPPVTPEGPGVPPVTEIPNTGMAGVITGIFGTSATAYGAYAWIESRRTLRNNR